MNVAVAITGSIASGKSTLASWLAARWSCPGASFGRLVARVAAARGLDDDRDTLQALGEGLIEELGWFEFCRQTLELAHADWSTTPLVIDGVRHRAALATLRTSLTARLILVHVTCDPATRVQRLLDRGAGVDDVRRWDRHETEHEVALLAAIADVVVCGTRPPGEAVAQIERAMRGEDG